MRKSLGLLALLAVLLTSCQSVMKTAKTANISTSVKNATVVDLKVDNRITYTLSPNKKVRRGGLSNIMNVAVEEALKENGGADVMLEPQYVITKRKGLFGSKITSITVTGRPARYTNYRTLSDSIWCNPVFNGISTRSVGYGLPFSIGNNNNTNSFEGIFREKGFTKYFTLTGMHQKFDDEVSNHSEVFTAGGLLSLGYQFSPYLYFGAGAGYLYDIEHDLSMLPIFANARVNLSKKRNTFFYDIKAGWTPLTFGKDFLNGRFFMANSFGYSIGNTDVAIQFLKQNFGVEIDYSEFTTETSCIGLAVGFRF